MKISDIKKTAFSMPLCSPSYPKGPYHFINREFFTITYETDIEKLKKLFLNRLKLQNLLLSLSLFVCQTQQVSEII